MSSKFGTREWAEVNKNILLGCEHNCAYCYGRYNAVKRFKTIKNVDDWKTPKIIDKKLEEKPRFYKGRIMFPTQHDILPKYLDETIIYLRKLLDVGNEILIVSKPHIECVKAMCNEFVKYKKQIVFRFTIGSPNNDVLKFWEPGAPDYDERLKSLQYAFSKDYTTSVSCEPILDNDIALMVYELLPFISDTIWLGKMNFIKPRVDTSLWSKDDFKYLSMVNEVNEDEFIFDLYDEFKDNHKVKWKESCKKVLGLADEDGVA